MIMNEVLTRLAEQASHQSPDGYPVTIPYNKDFAQKFAELVILHTLHAVHCGIEYGPSMTEAVYTYFGLEDEH